MVGVKLHFPNIKLNELYLIGEGWYADLGAMRFTLDHVVVMDVGIVFVCKADLYFLTIGMT